ncbi:hypothetical protein SLEP1_g32790 [Rubroshorea leprosula]|uniref:Uncharacterized protein n=1 Tax=Rubroshorea leprosula TaxID=152421 RepID=A0AAV5KEH4_9ROSI|nr:hypothetical protein SLEP1_g32790 [Rubroshorea leprosula]
MEPTPKPRPGFDGTPRRFQGTQALDSMELALGFVGTQHWGSTEPRRWVPLNPTWVSGNPSVGFHGTRTWVRLNPALGVPSNPSLGSI